jgi:hypothetical protein
MKETVQQLREGWYGSLEAAVQDDDGQQCKKNAVSCNKLYQTSLKCANEIFILMCGGSLRGKNVNIWVDPNYKEPTVDIPIDTLLNEYTTDMVPVEETAEEDA